MWRKTLAVVSVAAVLIPRHKPGDAFIIPKSMVYAKTKWGYVVRRLYEYELQVTSSKKSIMYFFMLPVFTDGVWNKFFAVHCFIGVASILCPAMEGNISCYMQYDHFNVLNNYSHSKNDFALLFSKAAGDEEADVALPSRTTNDTQGFCIATFDDDLRVMDFLFGNSYSNACCSGKKLFSGALCVQLKTGLVDGALQLLDDCVPIESDSINVKSHDNNVSTKRKEGNIDSQRFRRKKTATGISRLLSPNGRSVYLVANGTSNKKKALFPSPMINNPVGMECPKDECVSCYLCIVPDKMPLPTNLSSVQRSPTPLSAFAGSLLPDQPVLHYCSCQTYFDHSCRLAGNGFAGNRVADGSGKKDISTILCEHVLAIRLLHFFLCTNESAVRPTSDPLCPSFNIPTMKYVSEDDFSRAILQRILH